MNRLLTLLFLVASTTVFSQKQSVYQRHFESGLATLTKTEKDSFEVWFKSLQVNVHFTEEGHTKFKPVILEELKAEIRKLSKV